MSDTQLALLQSEWITLQTQFDSYEKCSLGIKLFSILTSCILVFALHAGLASLWVVVILWLQDAIWKTFQHRIGQRLEVVEQAIQDYSIGAQEQESKLGMQFNQAWNRSRPKAMSLVIEYLKQSLKPTVAYPHVILIILILVNLYVE